MSASSAPIATVADKPVRVMPRRVWPETIFRYGKWVKIHSWTTEEDEILRREYTFTLKSLDVLALKLGVTNNAVRQRLTRLGLLKLNIRKWTPEEEEYLRENYTQLSTRTLAVKLHMSRNAVVRKAHRLHVTQRVRDGWFTLSEVSKILGVDAGWVTRRIHNGHHLEMAPHSEDKVPKQGSYAAWHISEEALCDFIRRYPEELSGHNVDFVMLVDILAGIKN
ncbi:MAG: hypothetical protein PHQ43_09050 [Dehalococcoidales bacterium]|nr:hypothetical protein [Dehalococcoidales bacterium]